jgi:hypothetical protein
VCRALRAACSAAAGEPAQHPVAHLLGDDMIDEMRAVSAMRLALHDGHSPSPAPPAGCHRQSRAPASYGPPSPGSPGPCDTVARVLGQPGSKGIPSHRWVASDGQEELAHGLTGIGRCCWKPSWRRSVSPRPVTGRRAGPAWAGRKGAASWGIIASGRCRSRRFGCIRWRRTSGPGWRDEGPRSD